jgi:hypothetical protein
MLIRPERGVAVDVLDVGVGELVGLLYIDAELSELRHDDRYA